MPDFNPVFETDPNFVGRSAELEKLREFVFSETQRYGPTMVQGPAGVGKTALIKRFLVKNQEGYGVTWIDLNQSDNPQMEIQSFVQRMIVGRGARESGEIVVLDGADLLNPRVFVESFERICSWKPLRGMIVETRRPLFLRAPKTLELGPIDVDSAGAIIQSSSNFSINPIDRVRLAQLVHMFPSALKLLGELIRSDDPSEIERLLAGELYDISEYAIDPSSDVIAIARPVIISASESLVKSLKKRPEDLLSIAPRDFEVILAELLEDMGWEVQLTKATRDGGKDILAYMNTEVGRFLCLVEAKRFRSDRTVGVDLVRSLYGTLCDFQANSAMMVTTSSFTRDAREFQQRHQYQLSLRDYADVVAWIEKYKTPKRGL